MLDKSFRFNHTYISIVKLYTINNFYRTFYDIYKQWLRVVFTTIFREYTNNFCLTVHRHVVYKKLFNSRIVNYFKDKTHRKRKKKLVTNRWETWTGWVSKRHRSLWGVLSQAVNQIRRRLAAQPDTRIVDKTHNRSTYDGFFEFWKMVRTRSVSHVNARFALFLVLQ